MFLSGIDVFQASKSLETSTPKTVKKRRNVPPKTNGFHQSRRQKHMLSCRKLFFLIIRKKNKDSKKKIRNHLQPIVDQ